MKCSEENTYPSIGRLNNQDGNIIFSINVVLTVTMVASIGFVSLSGEGDSSQRSLMLKPQAAITNNASYREMDIRKTMMVETVPYTPLL